MELYQPIKVESKGERSKQYGVGIITPLGAYLTGPTPRMSNVAITVYLPKNTILKTKDGMTHVYHIPKHAALGVKQVPYKPRIHGRSHFAIDPPRPSTVTMNLAKAEEGDFDIVIEEVERGFFRITVKTGIGIYLQPFSGWAWFGSGAGGESK